MKNILEGLKIFERYDPDCGFSADHDQIWTGPGLVRIKPEDGKRLTELGWWFDREFECWSHFC